MFDYQYGLALLVGLAFGFPFGPTGLLATDLWRRGHRRSARAAVYGICAGDLIIALTILVGLKFLVTISIPKLLLALLLVIVSFVIWYETGSRRYAYVYRGPFRRFLLALGATLGQPANWGMYWSVYVLGTGYALKTYQHLLPEGFSRLQPVTELTAGQISVMLGLHLVGMMAVWIMYAMLLQRYRNWKGYPKHPVHSHSGQTAVWVGRCACGLVLSCALVLMVQGFLEFAA